MGQRSSKRLNGLFLLTIIIGFGCFLFSHVSMQKALKAERRGTLGMLVEQADLPEAQVMAAANQKITQQDAQKGAELEARYGLTTRTQRQQKITQRYFIWNLVIGGGGTILLSAFFIWNQSENRKQVRKIVAEMEQKQSEKATSELLLQRVRNEGNELKSSVTDIAHQLRTPVASLKMSMDIALSDKYSDQERSEFGHQAEIQIHKLNLMLDGLIKLSQLETDLIRLQPQPTSLKAVITDAVNSLIMKAIEKEIEIEVETFEDRLILIDQKWTLEAISNVLENAVKYSPAGTTIQLRISTLVTYVLLEILDQGPGIPSQEQTKIYQRFYRGANSEAVEGSGVGLYLTRSIIEGQGGAIMVKNLKPHGSNFQLTLPLA
ncbi:hypothetical protein NRIC_30510 [Enterococcus florum]|uniref:histidine kinase n=1 Tax=Enterococcus florum TaxID=2480627 RepID=A0A4P5PAZ5_9ENTE|nr:ATP-binding protein [Enterococcus florum]GCF95160.1 hypothetical protein NRIC_30510 [Enterococcus florum]